MAHQPQDDPVEQDFPSIFDGEPEAPAPGAHRFDDTLPEDPAAVKKEVLPDGHLHASVPVGDVDPYDHTAEQGAIDDERRKDGTAPPPLPDGGPTPLRNPNMMLNAADQVADEVERRFIQEFGDTKVSVTQKERDAFIRSALHDEEMIFDIELEGVGAVLKIAMAPDEFTNSASAVVNRWGKEDFIDKDSDLQWLMAFQQLHAWYQVRAINGEPTSWSDFWADGVPPITKIREAMRDRTALEPIFSMHAVRWRMILDAIRTAELKYKICMQNWKNRTFFSGADTD